MTAAARSCERPGCGDAIPASRGKAARYCSPQCQQLRRYVKGGGEQPGRPRRSRPPLPDGVAAAEKWQTADGGTVTSGPVEVRGEPGDGHTDWSWLLEMHGLSPEHFEIVDETVNARTWDAHYGVDQPPRKFAYYKADFRRRRPETRPGYDELRAAFLRRPPRERKPRAGGEPVTFVAAISDPQFGKGDGDGTPGTLARIDNGIAAVCEMVESYRAAGLNVEDVLIPWLGDNTENVRGHYAMQAFTADLTLTEQIEATTDAAVLVTRRLLEVAPRVLNVAVPGNHGEVRNARGKADTAFRDNMDTHGIKQAARVLRALPAYTERALFAFPEGEELSVTLRVRGRVHTFLHGHQGRVNAASAHAKIVRWIADQALGMRAPGESEFIWSGHYHHFSAVEVGRRVFVQAPALDGGSVWYAESAGIETPPGILTGVLNGRPGIAGLTHVTVIAGDPAPPTWADSAESQPAA